MKKIIIIVSLIVLIFIGLAYWSLSSTNKTFDTCEIVGFSDVEKIDFKKYDSVLVAASTLYEANDIKNVMQGAQYRKAWATPVKVPILYLNDLEGNLKVLEEGGGQQTHSLKLKRDDGTLMTLRSVSKDPSPLIPEIAETLGIENIVVDGISAQHPYAALKYTILNQSWYLFQNRQRLIIIMQSLAIVCFNWNMKQKVMRSG